MGSIIVPGIVLHASSQAQLDSFAAAPTHAVLLSGPKGIGKTHIAAALGTHLLGASPSELEHHPYYKIIAPIRDTITIEQIRGLIDFFKLKVPGEGSIKRVAVLHDVEAMGIEAQNALLKLLEEPPIDSILILTSSQPIRLLATIRSRLRQLQLPAPTNTELLQHFASAGYNETTIKAALRRSGTNIAEAKHLLDSDDGEADATITLVKQVLSASPYERLILVDTLAKQKDQAQLFAETLAIVATASLEAATAKGTATVLRWRDILQAAYTAQSALEQSGNTKLVLTELMLAL